MATCPECDAEVEIDDDDLEELEAGNPWDCEACGSSLRVSTVTPLEFESDEDDEDDDDEDEEKEDAVEEDDAEDGVDDEDDADGDKEWDE